MGGTYLPLCWRTNRTTVHAMAPPLRLLLRALLAAPPASPTVCNTRRSCNRRLCFCQHLGSPRPVQLQPLVTHASRETVHILSQTRWLALPLQRLAHHPALHPNAGLQTPDKHPRGCEGDAYTSAFVRTSAVAPPALACSPVPMPGQVPVPGPAPAPVPGQVQMPVPGSMPVPMLPPSLVADRTTNCSAANMASIG